MLVRLEFSVDNRHARAVRIPAASDTTALLRVELGSHLPFRDSSVDEVLVGRALAYVDEFVRTMEELWRIAKPGALIRARLPHASSTWAVSRDPRLQRSFTVETFRFFEPGQANGSSIARFEIDHARLHLKGARRGELAGAIDRFANQNRGTQYRFERWLAPLLGGFEELSLVLGVIKSPSIN